MMIDLAISTRLFSEVVFIVPLRCHNYGCQIGSRPTTD